MANSMPLYGWVAVILLGMSGCATWKQQVREPDNRVPEAYGQSSDTFSSAAINWRNFFEDEYLIALIDSALAHNQELNIFQQEMAISNNEVQLRKGEYLPVVSGGVVAGLEKEGRYTRFGAVDDQLTIKDGEEFPEPLANFSLGAMMEWEVDIWRKLRNAKDAAMLRYLETVEGRNFLVTELVAEIADTYYELLALDNLLLTINQNMEIQSDALRIVKLQKDNAKATQLAVNRFEAQLINTRNLQYSVRQRIVEAENHLYFLTARFPDAVPRNTDNFLTLPADSLLTGVPAQLLVNRPDIRRAELELQASKLDVQVARADFYPSLTIGAEAGLAAFNPAFLVDPYSLLYNVAGDLMAPLINRNAIVAAYKSANARQLQAVIDYEQTLLQAYLDVSNQLARMRNFTRSFEVKQEEVGILVQSVSIANSLFRSARADYVEILLTQEEALDAKLELIEIKGELLKSRVSLYRSLGGGWN